MSDRPRSHRSRTRRPACRIALTAALAAAAMPGCMLDDPYLADELGSDEQGIMTTTPAPSWARLRAVTVDSSCTGTMISPNHVLTAAHCMVGFPSTVSYSYRFTSASPDYTQPRGAPPAVLPDGVDGNDLIDTNGDFADLAIVTLTLPFPSPVTVATLAWQFPAEGSSAVKIGRGNHLFQPNPDEDLRSAPAVIDDRDQNHDGFFVTSPALVNDGDSGGPLYTADTHQIVGTLTGRSASGTQAFHTSVPHHLAWILDTIGYVWPGQPLLLGIRNTGTVLDQFPASTWKVCAYACDHSSCKAFDWRVGTCTLRSTLGGWVSAPGAISSWC